MSSDPFVSPMPSLSPHLQVRAVCKEAILPCPLGQTPELRNGEL